MRIAPNSSGSDGPGIDPVFRRRINLGLILLGVVWAVLAVVFGLTDLRISNAVANLRSPTAHFFERFGGFPGPALIILGLLIYATNLSASRKVGYALRAGGALIVCTGASYYMLAGFLGFWSGLQGLTLRTTIPVGLALLGFWILVLAACRKWGSDVARRYRVVSRIILRITFFVALALVQFMKAVWGRASFRNLGPGQADYSPWYFPQGLNGDRAFPSGHVVMAWLLLVLIVLTRYSPRPIRWAAWVVSFGWGLVVAYERIVAGAHFASDILFGIGLTILAFLLVYRRYGPPLPRRAQPVGAASSR